MSLDQFLLSADTTDLNYPEIRPTLDLNFARVKALDPRITFTRASGGSYVGADGLIKYAGVNEPRFDHDPVTGESLGFLVEEARTNIRTYSILFNAGVSTPLYGNWSSADISSNTAATAPDGTLTANRFRPTSPTATRMQRFSATAGVTYTISMYLKLDPKSPSNAKVFYFGFQVAWSNNGSTLTSSASSPTLGDQLTNEWKRFSFSYTLPAGAISMEMGPSNMNQGVGDPNYSVLAWGWQIEAGEFPTSYIPTVGSSRTRAADSVIMSGTNFTNWYNKSEGTFIFELNKTGYMNGDFAALFYIFNSYVRHEMYKRSGNSRIFYQYGDFNLGITYASLEITDGISSGKNIIFAHYKENDFGLGVNGIIKSTDNSGKSSVPFGPSNPYISFGSYQGSSEFWDAHIKKISYYPKRLTNQQLQVLTR